MLRPRNIDGWDFRCANEQLHSPAANIVRNQKFQEGDHFQNGEQWIGPRPYENDPDSAELWSRIVRGFVSKNIQKEIVGRVVKALLGQDPDFYFTFRAPRKRIKKKVPDPLDPTKQIDDPKGRTVPEPLTEQEQAVVDEYNRIAMEWWEKTKPLKVMKKALSTRLWAGKGHSHLFIPPALRSANGQAAQLDPIQWARHIIPDNPVLGNAEIVTDCDTMLPVGVLKFQHGDEDCIEVSFTNEQDQTVIIILKQGGEALEGEEGENNDPPPAPETDPDVEDETTLDPPRLADEVHRSDPLELAGHIPLFEIGDGEPLITEQIVQNNNSCNVACTMLNHNVVENGFSELILTNVELEETEKKMADGTTQKVPRRIKRGPTVTNNFFGVQTEDRETGKVTFATPGVHKFEPPTVENFIKAKEADYINCLEEVQQLHALLSKDAGPSGESRIQAISDFIISVLDYKDEVDTMGQDMLETAMGYIASLTGRAEQFKGLRAVFVSRIYVGRLTAEERAQVLAEVEKRIRSRASAMVLLGIDDPEAMDAEIEQEAPLPIPQENPNTPPKDKPPPGK